MTWAMFRVMALELWRDRGALVMAFLLPPLVFLIFSTTVLTAFVSAQQKTTLDAAQPDEAAVKKAVTEHWLGVADEI